MRRFQLQRDHDVSGISGTGIVADGVEFPDGTTVIRWRGERQSTVVWPSIEDVEAIHGHGGATRIVWIDQRGSTDTCVHCGCRLQHKSTDGPGWGLHAEGSAQGLYSCGRESGQPYGLSGHTAAVACTRPCTGDYAPPVGSGK